MPAMGKYTTDVQWNRSLQATVAKLAPVEMSSETGGILEEADWEVVDFAASGVPLKSQAVAGQAAAPSFDEHGWRVHGVANSLRSSEIRMGDR